MEIIETPRRSRKGIVLALLIILVGVLVLASNTGGILGLYKPLILSWPMLLVVVGLISLVNHRRFNYGSLFLVFLGLFFLIPRIGANDMNIFGWQVPYNFLRTYYPVLIIIAGLMVLVRWAVKPTYNHTQRCKNYSHKRRYDYVHNSGAVEINSVFGSGRHTILEEQFQGGEVNAVFGEVTLDLRKTSLPEGITHIELNVVFGSATIYVPRDWNVEIAPSPVFGAFQDKREPNNGEADRSRTLVIESNTVFGGGELLN